MRRTGYESKTMAQTTSSGGSGVNSDYLNAYLTKSFLAVPPITSKDALKLLSKDEVLLFSNSEGAHFVILVDWSVRNIKEISSTLDAILPAQWSTFARKLSSASQDVVLDKFLYTHDVGLTGISDVSFARIPLDMYQKLDLARKLAEKATATGGGEGGNPKSTIIIMMGQYGELFLDADMCLAIQAGTQAANFAMPKITGGSKAAAAASPMIPSEAAATRKKTEAEDKGKSVNAQLLFLAPPEDEASTSDEEEQGRAEGEDEVGGGEKPWHYFDETKGDTEIEKKRKEKMSALEAAMLAASGEREKERREEEASAALSSAAKTHHSSIIGAKDLSDLQRQMFMSAAVNTGTNFARALASLPPNVLSPASYVEALRLLAANKKWEIKEWNTEELAKMGAGAFCAVCQGNVKDELGLSSDRLVRIRVSPTTTSTSTSSTTSSSPSTSKMQNTGVTLNQIFSTAATSKVVEGFVDRRKPLLLVGKGVTYDTGGINVKTANSMKTMKHDMAGSSAALGVLLALSEIEFPHPIECWLAIAENNMSPVAYRPDDVVTAITGETIEIVHTDAEGRLLLADTLALASRKSIRPEVHDEQRGGELNQTPILLVDFATLTGTCITSLSNRYIGAFTNRKELTSKIIAAGEKSGERVWPFPCDDDFADDLKSDIADVLQCRQPTEADHIYATSFLKRFVNPLVPWIHLDLGSAHRAGGLGHVGSDYTGSGVRSCVEIIKQQLKINT